MSMSQDCRDWIHACWPQPKALPPLTALTTTQQSDWTQIDCPEPPRWLTQVHGAQAIHLDDWHTGIAADAAWTDRPRQVAVIKTADCLPVFLASQAKPMIAAVHAGWRGLAGGVLETTIEAMPTHPSTLQAWIGPAISQSAFEVGEDVYQAFVGQESGLAHFFQASRPHHWHADLVGIAVIKLKQLGVCGVSVAGLCTASDPTRFYSYRAGLPKGRETARMASLIWLR